MTRPLSVLWVAAVLAVACAETGAVSGADTVPVADGGAVSDTAGAPEALPLAASRHWLLSRRGAHAYLAFSPGSGAGPQLYWRQMGDVLSHFGLFSPLLQPLAQVRAAQGCAETAYAWRGYAVERELDCGALRLRETTLFASPEAVDVHYEVLAPGDETVWIEGPWPTGPSLASSGLTRRMTPAAP